MGCQACLQVAAWEGPFDRCPPPDPGHLHAQHLFPQLGFRVRVEDGRALHCMT